jgi:hypothetical protein
MDSEGLLQPASGIYPESDKSNLRHPIQLFVFRLNIITLSKRRSSETFLSFSFFSTEILFPSIRATCCAHIILVTLLSRIIFGEEYKA